MSTENVGLLITAVNALKNYFEEIRGSVDAKVAAAKSQIDTYIAGARGEMPFYRMTKNQRLLGTNGSVPEHWSSGSGITYTLVETVRGNIPWADRTALEKEVLTAMGCAGTRYLWQDFKVWRMAWSSNSPTYTMYQQMPSHVTSTAIAVCKVESGSISGHWAEGATTEWKITGQVYGRGVHMYTHCHPIKGSVSGSLLFALPCVIAGKHHFNNHGIYPLLRGYADA